MHSGLHRSIWNTNTAILYLLVCGLLGLVSIIIFTSGSAIFKPDLEGKRPCKVCFFIYNLKDTFAPVTSTGFINLSVANPQSFSSEGEMDLNELNII